MVNSFLNNTNLSNFIENEMPSEYILNKEINTKNKTIDLVIIGNTIDNSEEEKLQNTLKYYNFSGCGNTVNCNHPVVIKMIQDCLRYWVAEYRVDVFRFDLASILGRNEDG